MTSNKLPDIPTHTAFKQVAVALRVLALYFLAQGMIDQIDGRTDSKAGHTLRSNEPEFFASRIRLRFAFGGGILLIAGICYAISLTTKPRP